MGSEQNRKESPPRYSIQTVSLPLSENQKKKYYEDLFELYEKSKWKHLSKWDKNEFFRLWFIAISKKYVRGYLKLEIVIARDKQTKKIRRIPLYDDFDGMQGTDQIPYRFKLPFDRKSRRYFLCDMWKEDPRLRDNESHIFKHSQFEPLPPVKNTSLEKVQSDLKEFKKLSQCNELRLFYINIHYPLPFINRELNKIIDKEKEKLFLSDPQKKQIFKKAHRYKDFDQYLKIYMLYQMGKKSQDLFEYGFYKSKDTRDYQRQIDRAIQKAKNLSVNALTLNFPGKF